MAGILVCASCGHSKLSQCLSDIESVLESRPDSALVLIRQIDTTAIRGRSVKALYSLLNAAALDKNYIDTADTRYLSATIPITMGSGHYVLLFTLPSGKRYIGEFDV
ncbi:MAG: hypothetical protein IJ840_04685 [Bacteroidales bacterium]|nr:hypothetical protein [Bacteroidales bacterium]